MYYHSQGKTVLISLSSCINDSRYYNQYNSRINVSSAARSSPASSPKLPYTSQIAGTVHTTGGGKDDCDISTEILVEVKVLMQIYVYKN